MEEEEPSVEQDNVTLPQMSVLQRLRSSRRCLFLYASVTSLCLVLFVLELLSAMSSSRTHYDISILRISVEAIVCSVLASEMLVSLVAVRFSPQLHFMTWEAKVDVVVLFSSILLFLLADFQGVYTKVALELSLFDVLVLVLRFLLQAVRIWIFLKRSHQSRNLTISGNINFAPVETSDLGSPSFALSDLKETPSV